ncbi:MAG: endonuclease/exonuclease/phosphatase family protein [Candidatus Parabeggiatoa sp. nov. 1]|nr:MAG: endonuclease/exonuclease/phosphatase family protein [Gammaproteobacteria bacterium]
MDSETPINRCIEVKKSTKTFLLRRIKLLAAGVVLLSLAGYLGTVYWMFELTSHFKVQYLALSLFCALVFSWARLWRWASLGLLGIVLNGSVVLSWYVPNTETAAQNPHLSVLLANVNIRNKNYSALLELVKTENPAILIVQEANAGWIKQLQMLDKWPYRVAPPKSYGFGTVIVSRFPFEQTQILSLGTGGRESILVKIKINGKLISLLTTHPLPPISQELFRHRNSQLFAANSVIKQLSTPKILIGDLNISMWSPVYSKLLSNTGLVNARQGFGILPTWPTTLPFLMIPIDHCLISSDIKVVNIRTARRIGSDHLPLIVELAI